MRRAYEEEIQRGRFREKRFREVETSRVRALEVEWIAYCERERWVGETLTDAGHRLVILRAYEDGGCSQRAAAGVLGLSPRMVNFHMQKWGMQRKQRKATQ